jgi:hypothetical protein
MAGGNRQMVTVDHGTHDAVSRCPGGADQRRPSCAGQRGGREHRQTPNGIGTKIKDDGKSFQADRVLQAKKNNRLGRLGMRERVEMVGGNFAVDSAPGKGTTIRALIPVNNGLCLQT